MWDKFSVFAKKTKGQNSLSSQRKPRIAQATPSTPPPLHLRFAQLQASMSITVSFHLAFVELEISLPTRCGTKFPVSTRKTKKCRLSHIAAGEELLRWSSINSQQGREVGHLLLSKQHYWSALQIWAWCALSPESKSKPGHTVFESKIRYAPS